MIFSSQLTAAKYLQFRVPRKIYLLLMYENLLHETFAAFTHKAFQRLRAHRDNIPVVYVGILSSDVSSIDEIEEILKYQAHYLHPGQNSLNSK